MKCMNLVTSLSHGIHMGVYDFVLFANYLQSFSSSTSFWINSTGNFEQFILYKERNSEPQKNITMCPC